jgi:formamidase
MTRRLNDTTIVPASVKALGGALLLIGSLSIALADTSDVRGPAPLIVAKSGEHCKDDPNCFKRIHDAIKPAAHVKPGQQFALETRDGLDSDLNFNSTSEDVAAINLNLCHPLTGPV